MSRFIQQHKKDWEELESLIRKGRKSLGRLTPQQRQRLDVLYRRVTVQLARVSSLTRDQHLTDYLNGLTAAAHSLIYLPPRGRVLQGTLHFITEGFARTIIRNWKPHSLAALLVVAGGLIGYFAALSDPLMMHALWPPRDDRQPGSTSEQLLAVLRAGRDQGGGEKFLFTSFLFQHNLRVGILAMVTGILASVPTLFLMLFNGMLLGVFVAIHHQAGIHAELWAWLLPHGVTELGAIMLFGGVGFMMGQAVIRPGRMSRKTALLEAGKEGAKICLGGAVMLALAAIFESYVRQSHMTTAQRLTFAAATAIFWAGYLFHGWLRERQAQRLQSADDADLEHDGRLTADSAAAVQ